MKNGELIAKYCGAYQSLDGDMNYITLCLFKRKDKYIIMNDQGVTNLLFNTELQYFKDKEKSFNVFLEKFASHQMYFLKQFPEIINEIHSFEEKTNTVNILKEPQDIVDKDFIHFECHDDKLKKAVYEVGYKNLKKLKGEG
jgi:endo-1,4-beta-D-glucanase Y